MKLLLGILLLLFMTAVGALFIARNPGYVLIAREPFVLETSLAVFLLLLVILLVAFYALARVTIRLLHAPRDLSHWRLTRRTRRARQAFYDGLALLLGGEWLKAEKTLLPGLRAADEPLFGYLAAAVSAHGQHDPEKRDRYLASAREQAGDRTLIVDLLRIRLLLESGEQAAAQSLLNDLRAMSPLPPEVVRQLVAVSRQLQDWQGLLQILPEARRRQLLPAEELDAAETEAHHALLGLDLPAGSLDTLHEAWHTVPARLREQPSLVAAYARQLVRQQAAAEAAELVRKTLKHHWDDSLALLYSENPAAQIETAEEWRSQHGDSPNLLLALGRLAQRAQRPDQARQHLERSLSLGGGSAAHAALADLLAAQNQTDEALDHYRQAVRLAASPSAGNAPGVPAAAGRAPTDYGY